jgi:hypothetical protein
MMTTRELEQKIEALRLGLAWEEGYRAALQDNLSKAQKATENPYLDAEVAA